MTEPAPIHLPTQAGYDRWAEVYDGDGNPLIALEERIVYPLIGDVRGLSVADIGCGTGRHSLALASRGASVTAVDFSAGMLAQAKAKPGAERVRWVQHDLAQPLPLADASCDLVLCALVLDHIKGVPELMSQLRRVCKPGGRVVITVMHPAMMLRGVQARFTDPASGVKTMPASVPNQISDYVLGALNAGLTIGHMSEHAVDDELIRVAPRAEKHRGWSLLLVMAMTA